MILFIWSIFVIHLKVSCTRIFNQAFLSRRMGLDLFIAMQRKHSNEALSKTNFICQSNINNTYL
jgi:hypothetical protein